MPFLVALLLFVFTGTALPHEFTAGSLTIVHPMARQMPPGARIGGGYLTVVNTGATADRLIAIESEAAERVELHRSVVENGIARMVPLEGGLAIPAGATVVLGEDGTHAMFIDPKAPFRLDEMIPATLVFEAAGRVAVEFKVEAPTASPQAQHAHH